METPVILSAVRTPIGKFQGGLSQLFPRLTSERRQVAEAIRRSGLEAKQIDEAILGNVVTGGTRARIRRAQAALKGGCDPRVAAGMTINKVCGSGTEGGGALAAQAVQLGEVRKLWVAGGDGVYVQLPISAAAGRRHGLSAGAMGKIVDSMIHDGLWGRLRRFPHGDDRASWWRRSTGSRAREQDRFRGWRAIRKRLRARKSCFFEAQILPIEVPQKKRRAGGDQVRRIAAGGHIDGGAGEAEASVQEGMARVTAGNAPGTNDGGRRYG